MKICVIFNPMAGMQTTDKIPAVIDILIRDHTVSLHRTRYPRHAAEIAAQACAEKSDVILVAGGDGTLGDVVKSIVDHKESGSADVPQPAPKIAILPLGTANLIARELAMTDAFQSHLANLETWRTVTVWPAKINNHAFILSAGLGFDAAVVGQVSIALKRKISRLAYLVAAFSALKQNWECRFAVIVDGTEYRAASLLCTTGLYYAVNRPISTFTALTAPWLNVLVFERGKKRDIVLYGLCLLGNCLTRHRHVKCIRAKTLEIREYRLGRAQVDGDEFVEDVARIEVSLTPVEILVPAGGSL